MRLPDRQTGPQSALSPGVSLQKPASVSLLTKVGVTDALDVNGRGMRVAEQRAGGDETTPGTSRLPKGVTLPRWGRVAVEVAARHVKVMCTLCMPQG